MKYLLLTLIFTASIFAAPILEFTMKDGKVEKGQLICEFKGRLTLKTDNSGTVSFFKKSIKMFGEQNVAGEREFILGDSLMLVNKNEIAFIISTADAARIKLRKILPNGDEELLGEQSGIQGDTLTFFVPDGKFYEAVEYTRGDAKYFMIGSPFEMISKCESFKKVEIDLRGAIGDRIPQLKGDEMKFKRDGN